MLTVFWSRMSSVCLISSFQVVREGRSAQPISADSLLCTEASWDSSQCKQTGWPTNTPPTASLLYRNPCSASLLGLPVPQHISPYPNTSLVWKAQSEGIAGWVPLSVSFIKYYHTKNCKSLLPFSKISNWSMHEYRLQKLQNDQICQTKGIIKEK